MTEKKKARTAAGLALAGALVAGGAYTAINAYAESPSASPSASSTPSQGANGNGAGNGQGEKGQRQILRPGNVSTLFGFQRGGGDAAIVIVLQQGVLGGGPFVRITAALSHQTRDWPARHAARGLDEHVQFITVGKAPHDLAHVIRRQGSQAGGVTGFRIVFHKMIQAYFFVINVGNG